MASSLHYALLGIAFLGTQLSWYVRKFKFAYRLDLNIQFFASQYRIYCSVFGLAVCWCSDGKREFLLFWWLSACITHIARTILYDKLTNVLNRAACGAAAQRHPLTDIPPPAPGIEHKEWFPEFFSLQFPAGKQVRTSQCNATPIGIPRSSTRIVQCILRVQLTGDQQAVKPFSQTSSATKLCRLK